MESLMERCAGNDLTPVLAGPNSCSCMWRRWVRFFLCLLLVWVFMFLIAPIGQRLPAVQTLTEYVAETGINASALYYTGVEETAEAEMYLHNTGEYTPSGP